LKRRRRAADFAEFSGGGRRSREATAAVGCGGDFVSALVGGPLRNGSKTVRQEVAENREETKQLRKALRRPQNERNARRSFLR
jgi:hypothetical protein